MLAASDAVYLGVGSEGERVADNDCSPVSWAGPWRASPSSFPLNGSLMVGSDGVLADRGRPSRRLAASPDTGIRGDGGDHCALAVGVGLAVVDVAGGQLPLDLLVLRRDLWVGS